MSLARLRLEALELCSTLQKRTEEIRTHLRGAGANLQGVNLDSYLDLVSSFLTGAKAQFDRDADRIKRHKEDEDEIVEELQRLTVEEDTWEDKFRSLRTKTFNIEHEKENLEVKVKDLQRENDRIKLSTDLPFIPQARQRRLTWADKSGLPLTRSPGDKWRKRGLIRSKSDGGVAALKQYLDENEKHADLALTPEEVQELFAEGSPRGGAEITPMDKGGEVLSEDAAHDVPESKNDNEKEQTLNSVQWGSMQQTPSPAETPKMEKKNSSAGGSALPAMTPPPVEMMEVAVGGADVGSSPKRPMLKKSKSVTRLWNRMTSGVKKLVKKRKNHAIPGEKDRKTKKRSQTLWTLD